MPVTITGGVSFSGGGVSMVGAPPTVATAGWYGGGNGPVSTIDRITFATDTATATARGPLSSATYNLGASGNLTYGWWAGGVNPGVAPFYSLSTVQRITYATDTATASVRGSLAATNRTGAGSGNTSDGWFGGGYNGPGAAVNILSLVSRITYATDTNTASQRGPLSLARTKIASASDNSAYSWFAGGNLLPGPLSTVDRITYATDTATASVRGPLTAAKYNLSAMGNSAYGWFCSGYVFGVSAYSSSVIRIDYANDTTTPSIRGPLSSARRLVGAAGNDTDGWVSAGGSSPGPLSTVDRITYATDTNTASVRGPLTSARYGLAGAAGLQ
jgi:hypothetical protein